MDPIDSSGVVNDDQAVTPRPIGQVTVRFEPAADAGTAADGEDAEFLAPGLEEAGYGYGV